MRRSRILCWLAPTLFALCVVGAAAFFFLLPDLLESERLKARLPAGPVHWNIRRVGPTGLDAADIRLGPADRPAVSAEALRIDYGPASVLDGRIAAVHLSGVRLFLEWRDGRLALRSADRLRFSMPARDPESTDAPGPPPPFPVKIVRVRNGRIHLDTPAGSFLLPFDGELAPAAGASIAVRLRLHLRGQAVDADLTLDREAGLVRAEIRVEGLDLARFADLARLVPGLVLDGRLDLLARFSLNLVDFRLSATEIRLALRDGAPAFAGLRFAFPAPLRLTLESPDGDDWHLRDMEIGLAAPLPAIVSSETLTFRRDETGLRWDGNLAVSIGNIGDGDGPANRPLSDSASDPASDSASGPVLAASATLPLRLSGAFSDDTWSVELANAEADPKATTGDAWEIRIGETRIRGKRPSLVLKAAARGSDGTLSAEIGIPKTEFSFGELSLRFGRMAADATARFGDGGLRGAGALTGTEARLDAENARLAVSRIRLELDEADLSGGTGTLFLEGGEIRSGEVRANGIAGRIPLTWPWEAAKTAGEISARATRTGDRDIGPVSGSVRQTDAGVAYRLRHASRIVPGAGVNLTGETRFMGTPHRTEISFETRHRIDPPLDLGRFDPAARGIALSGDLAISGTLTADACGVRAPADIALTGGTVTVADPPAEARGISLVLPMADLIALRGVPGGVLRMEQLTSGTFRIDDLNLDFQIEPSPALLVERAGFAFSGGTVEARAFRIWPGRKDFDLLLYADRIHLARFLDQLGAGRAEGEGTVSGRIPVRFREGEFRFSDGVLFSTPGRGGTLHVTGAEALAAAAGTDTPQGAQVDLALAALESFDYEWARLRLNSEGNALFLSLEFDGRPTEPLPFEYRESVGGFVRTGPGGVRSRFQGIRLNLNLALPLDDLLRYRGIFDMIHSGE
jgi:hypothetical protein